MAERVIIGTCKLCGGPIYEIMISEQLLRYEMTCEHDGAQKFCEMMNEKEEAHA